MIGPIIEELAEEYTGKIKFVQVNAPDNLRLCNQYRVQAMPTLLFFKAGQPQAQLVGGVAKDAIESKLRELQT